MKSHKNYYAAAGRNGFAVAGNYNDILQLNKYLGRAKHLKGFASVKQAVDWVIEEYNAIQGFNLAETSDFTGCGDLILTKNLIKKKLSERAGDDEIQ